MNDCMDIKEEEYLANTQPLLFHINGECLETLEKTDYKMRFGVGNAKLEDFHPVKSDDDLDPVEAASEML